MSSISGIYQIVNKVNNKRYIGSSVDIYRRWGQHEYELRRGMHPAKHLQSAWDKYGEDNFEFSIIKVVKDIENILRVEQEYLDEHTHEYNTILIAGNNLGYRHTEDAKKRMSIIHTGFKHTEESKRKMSDYWKGRPRGKYTDERVAKHAAAMRGCTINEKQRAALDAGRLLGRTKDVYEKIANANRGKVRSDETKKKLSIARRKRVISEETKQKTSASLRAFHDNKKRENDERSGN